MHVPPLPSPATFPAVLDIDEAAGVAWLRGVRPIEYGQAYWDECLEYHNSPIAERLTRLRIELVKRHAKPWSTLVDVGIGSGKFLQAWRATEARNGGSGGMDVNPQARQWLAARGWLVEPTEFRASPKGPRWPVVTLWDVFEHLEDPDELLDPLADGTKVFLSLPIYRDFSGLAQSKHFKPGEHVSYWTHDGLVRYFAERRFYCVESNDLETQAGRESIRSYAFVRLAGRIETFPEPNGTSLLITNGIGDFLAAESFWPESRRSVLETVYYATREHRAIRELLEAFAAHYQSFPRLRHHVVLWDQFADREGEALPFCFLSAAAAATRVRIPPGVEDFSIARVFPEVTEGALRHTGSTALRYTLADVEHLELPKEFVVVCPTTDDDTPDGRNFSPDDWESLHSHLRRFSETAVVLGGAPTDGDYLVGKKFVRKDWDKRFIDLRGHTSLVESIEVLKRASGYAGIDSCLSVLAARLFRWPRLMIKCVRPTGGWAWPHAYWYPRAGHLMPPRRMPWLGRSIDELATRVEEWAVNELMANTERSSREAAA